MGEQAVRSDHGNEEVRNFTQALLADVHAVEEMHRRDMFERGARRMGVEQEMFLVDNCGRPKRACIQMLERINDERFTTELAQYNLEANLPPQELRGRFLSELEHGLNDIMGVVRRAGTGIDVLPILVGILPTLRTSDFDLSSITPRDRYHVLNDAIMALRGGDVSISIRGVDELQITAESVILESAATSVQLHLQVDPDDFARLYNLAQLITAPLLAAAVNSATLLGRRLWHESRVAIFESAVDARSSAELVRGGNPRVSFGGGWLRESVVELFKSNASRYRVLLTREIDEDSVALVEAGQAPQLKALSLHNGTIWRWNRPCYGVVDGVPHLRIENRVLPAGPTVVDEVANAALFYGLMQGLDYLAVEIPDRLRFADAQANFLAAARYGLSSQLAWLDNRSVPTQQLLLEELIPAAWKGLSELEVPEEDIERYLGIIEKRVEMGRTGAKWMSESLAEFDDTMPRDAQTTALTRAMMTAQEHGEPVHTWTLASPSDARVNRAKDRNVAEIMTTDLFTVRPEDVVDLATNLMEWEKLRHVPVEDDKGELVGLVSHRALLRLRAQYARAGDAAKSIPVADIMDPDPPTVHPDTPLHEALRLLLSSDTGCLVAVGYGRAVGIVTEKDFLRAALELFELAHEQQEAEGAAVEPEPEEAPMPVTQAADLSESTASEAV